MKLRDATVTHQPRDPAPQAGQNQSSRLAHDTRTTPHSPAPR